ncbi:unnamed protein product [Acanthosepion pharaonis]|uniref:Uncharacterized protein n=1 Tax=Acanthosepion pharaonis TaxID=158019 RepID=A0A812EZJ5_ACAPH|nr:unnamed protein product [Sepia pharaonis]
MSRRSKASISLLMRGGRLVYSHVTGLVSAEVIFYFFLLISHIFIFPLSFSISPSLSISLSLSLSLSLYLSIYLSIYLSFDAVASFYFQIYFSFFDSTFFFLYNTISFFFDPNSSFRIFTVRLSFLTLPFPFNPTSYSHYSFFILDFLFSYCPSLFFIDYLNFFFSSIRDSFLIILSLSSFIFMFINYAYSFYVHLCPLFTLSLFAHSLII